VQTEGEASGGGMMADMPQVRSQGAIDLEYESDAAVSAPSLSKHQVNYVTSHKGPCLTAAFSHDGKLAASGSADFSIKMVDVEAVFSRSAQGHHTDVHPVIRSFYDHAGGVTTMDFHPTVSILASGSKDCSIRLFDYSKPSAKRAYQVVQEVAPIRCISFHPSGDFMIVGTEQSTLRLYDMTTQQCFVSSDARDQHAGPVTALHYSLDGRLYATCSKDGSIKVWDGISNRCVSTFHNAHSGQM
jgi:cleavage stimulation factor subunit 1